MIVVNKFYPSTIVVDGEDVKIRVTRLSIEQASAFTRDLYKSAHPESDARIARTDSAEDQAKNEKGQFLISDDDVADRRVKEMSADDRMEFDDMKREEGDFAVKLLKDAITNYILVEAGQIHDADADVDITTGAGMLAFFGARQDVLTQLLSVIRIENVWDDVSKKRLRSLSASARSSSARQSAVPGESLVQTAAVAETPASVNLGGVDVLL